MLKMIKKVISHRRLTLGYPKKTFESKGMTASPKIDHSLCVGCGECILRCPSGAIVKNIECGKIGINYDECLFCALCSDVCPNGAAKMSTDFELAQKDRALLRNNPIVITSRDIPDEDYNVLEDRLHNKIKSQFKRSLKIREIDAGSCNGCDYEINALNNPFNDIERLGISFVASPRHADMLLITGTATRNMELALVKTINATPQPRLIVAVGACACSGGIFRDSYSTRNGIDCIVPVDVYIPGCPPRPQAIIYGILKAIDRK
jgi:Ni,Fe-hydrogenase III small subunit/formate hydrogenlyase subunit 6/NADH:ubiquinone oxidoreductase subunit I